jgi:probable rRNA maturation factor
MRKPAVTKLAMTDPNNDKFDVTIEIQLEDDAWTSINGLSELCHTAITHTLRAVDFRQDGELSILFASDARLQQLNKTYRLINKPTNVLAFSSDPPMLGDIALAFATVSNQAEEQLKPMSDHIAHLLVHGTLHLFEFDHHTNVERERMEALERDILAQIGIPDPYQ